MKSHVEEIKKRKRKNGKEWTNKQARCVLYWQNSVRKLLTTKCRQMIRFYRGTVHTLTPEAMGVHVIRTAKKVGIPIKTHPTDIVFKIALMGFAKQDGREDLW